MDNNSNNNNNYNSNNNCCSKLLTNSTIQYLQSQLDQVLVALEVNFNSKRLLKLKNDLEEMINEQVNCCSINSSTCQTNSSTCDGNNSYKIGQRVLAPWSVDNVYYEAVILDFIYNNQCKVSISTDNYFIDENRHICMSNKPVAVEVCSIDSLKQIPTNCNFESSNKQNDDQYLMVSQINNKRSLTHSEFYKSKDQPNAKQVKLFDKVTQDENDYLKRKLQDFANETVVSKKMCLNHSFM